MPEEPKTQELPAANPIEIQIHQLALTLARIEANIGALGSHVDTLDTDLRAVQKWRLGQDERASRHSDRVNGLAKDTDRISEHDLEQESKIADVIVWRAAADRKFKTIETKVDGVAAATTAQTVILNRVDGIAQAILQTKEAKRIGQALAALVLAAILWATGYFMRGGK